ncbi:MAG: TVP38/TMEM64 family protein [Nitrospirota bacterium]
MASTDTCPIDTTGSPATGWSRSIRLVGLGLVAAILAGLAWLGGLAEWVDLTRLVPFLQGLGVLAPVALIIAMAAAVVISPIPSFPLSASAGAVFGPLWGTVYSVLGAEAGALICFGIGRALGRDAIVRFFGREVGFCPRCAEHHLFTAILISRLLPIFSFDLVSYGAGLTRLSVRGFALATLLGMIPATFVVNYFGSGIFSNSTAVFLLGGVLVLLFFLVPRWIVRRNPWGLHDRLEAHRAALS